ncbi:unnamed protein product [Pedinophyceae sp. YPF-701]|nr:unnamed protein product [Pedinophyceae sp. YPF-701]
MPAQAYEFQGSYSSYYVTLGLFLMTAPGLWSLIKRAPKAAVKRQTFEIDGPKVEGAKPLDDVARGVAAYFLKYNYNVAGTGEVITFEGTYQASKSQAFAITTYTLFSLASIALVLSIVVPDVGNWWYSMVLLSPLAGYYYWSNGDRQEQVKVKMVTADDEMTTDIIVEGDKEELERFAFELGFVEKGKVRVKGVLEG